MDYQTFRSRLDYEHRNQPKRASLIAFADWALKDARPWLWQELASIIGQSKASPLQAQHALRQGCRTSDQDYMKMPEKKSFYIAQLSMFDSEVNRVCGAIQGFVPDATWYAEDAKIDIYQNTISRFLDYAIILLDQASMHCQKKMRYGTGAREVERPFEIFKGAEQVVYTRYSGLTHDDHAPYISIAILRTAIEIRLRDAFGIHGLYNTKTGDFSPIDLSNVIDAIKKHISLIKFAADFDDTVKVYKWSNFYLHRGWRDFPWVAGFALQYLRPLFGPPPVPGKSWSIDGGIAMPRSTWHAIRRELDPAKTRKQWLLRELYDTFRSVLKRRRNRSNWGMLEIDEKHAACVFTD